VSIRTFSVFGVVAVSLFARTALADGGDDGADDYARPAASTPTVDTQRESDDFPVAPAVIIFAPKPSTIETRDVAAPKPEVTAAKHFPPAPVAKHFSDDAAGAANDPHAGALGALRLGALAGVGAPSIFSGEALAKIGDWVGLSGDYGVAPSLSVPIGNGGATISQTTVSAGARVYPFRGAFFLGGAVGQQSVDAKVTQSAQGVTGAANFQTKTMFIEPQIGLLYRFKFGLAIGCDVGLEIPVQASGQSSMQQLPGPLEQAMTYAEKGPIPSVNLLRLGYVL
jgi:hypothetical protein